MYYKFRIDGEPIPNPRPRAYIAGKSVRFYKAKPKEFQALRDHLASQWFLYDPIEVPLSIKFLFGMPKPKMSTAKAEALEGQPHAKRPDIDNLIKWVMDAALGILYKDDGIVHEVTASKIYVDEPFTEITLMWE